MPVANPVAAAVEAYRGDPHYLVQIVREAQASLGWISPDTIGELAELLEIPRTRIESVVQFYSFFYDRPRGAYRLLLSDNITDRMLGSLRLLAALPRPIRRRSAARSARRPRRASISPPAPACAIRARRCSSTTSRSRG